MFVFKLFGIQIYNIINYRIYILFRFLDDYYSQFDVRTDGLPQE